MCRRVRFPPASGKMIFRSSIFFFPPSFEVFSFCIVVNDCRYDIRSVVATGTIEQFQKEILQFIPRDCFARLGLSMLSRRLDDSCTIRFFGSATRFVSQSLFHTMSTIESMLDDRGSLSWFLWQEDENKSESLMKAKVIRHDWLDDCNYLLELVDRDRGFIFKWCLEWA